MRKIILASHGDLARGLLHSVNMILGEQGGTVAAYGLYPGESAEDFALKLEEEVKSYPETEFVLLSDLFGASVCTALTRLTQFANVRLFSGMNLALLLQLLTGYPKPLSERDIEELISAAREQIKLINIIEDFPGKEDF